jgi:hypothetical protein
MENTERDEALLKFRMDEVLGRARISLQNILPLLETAHDFASLEPPRPYVVIERLEMSIDAIKKQIECFRGEQAWKPQLIKR